jgi:hypothetical protein
MDIDVVAKGTHALTFLHYDVLEVLLNPAVHFT